MALLFHAWDNFGVRGKPPRAIRIQPESIRIHTQNTFLHQNSTPSNSVWRMGLACGGLGFNNFLWGCSCGFSTLKRCRIPILFLGVGVLSLVFWHVGIVGGKKRSKWTWLLSERRYLKRLICFLAWSNEKETRDIKKEMSIEQLDTSNQTILNDGTTP